MKHMTNLKRNALMTHFRWASFLILAACTITCGLAQTPDPKPTPVDPIVGRWVWFNNQSKEFHPDGTATGEGGQGTWKRISNATPAKYEVIWAEKFIDTLYLKGYGKELEGKNQKGQKVSAQRIPDKH